jgi:hypothetical protein
MSKVAQFITDLEIIDPIKASIVSKVLAIFRNVAPNLSEKFIYGGIGFFIRDTQIGGIYVSKQHVSVTFSDGKSFNDPKSLLLGTGKYRRYLKITNQDDIEESAITNFIQQALNRVE